MIYEKKNKIYLIGFMGSGKSTLGKKIANALRYDFSDLDSYIESLEGQTIASIFEAKGEDYFRKIESEYLSNYNDKEYIVVATGGGTPCFNNNMELMLEQGCCVYIKMKEGVLHQRLNKTSSKRPLLAGKKDEELRTFINDTLKLREEIYNRSHIIVDIMNLSLPSLINLLKHKVSLRP